MIWARADGCRVWDEDGREYIDLTGGFGVAVLGHGNARIREAVATAPVVHALGDLAEAEVTQRLRDALPWPAKFGVTGEDAVEIALRTALLATGRAGKKSEAASIPAASAARTRNTLRKPPSVRCRSAISGTPTAATPSEMT